MNLVLRKSGRVPLVGIFVLAACGSAWGQAPPMAPVIMQDGLTLGFPSTSRARLPLEDFEALNPALRLKELAWSRNPMKPLDTPLPVLRDELPPVLAVHAGDFAEDIRQLVERRLIVPVDEMLAALAIKREEFPPAALEALSYRGSLYAIPQHIAVPVLRYWREPFDGQAPAPPASWEELLALGKPMVAGRGAPGPKRVLSIPMSTTRFAAMVAMACGEPPLDVGNLSFLRSAGFESALRWVIEGKANGLIQYRQVNTPLWPAYAAVFGIDFVDSLNLESPFGLLPFPTRLHASDTAAEHSHVPGRVEGMALRSLSAQHTAGATALLRWLYSPETEWRMFERTNARTIADRWLLDNTHVPLRGSTMQSLDFEYALKKYPDLVVLREQNARATFAKVPAPLEDLVWELLEASVDYLPKDADLHVVLEQLAQEAERLVRNTTVPTVAYAEY